jgi:hypothetical protein
VEPEGKVVVAMVNSPLVMVAVALECTEPLAALVAVTVTDFRLVPEGAVHNPLLEMLPALADQTTAVLLVFLTVAANCTLPPAATDGSAGEICRLTSFVAEATDTV